MSTYTIQLTHTAADDLDHIPYKLRQHVISDINYLRTTPFQHAGNSKKLKGFKYSLYRLRTGNFRILYRIDDCLLTIMRIIDRKELEKIIKLLH